LKREAAISRSSWAANRILQRTRRLPERSDS
jgi:hypothetical protein